MARRLKALAPTRSVTNVVRGDWIKVQGRWERIVSNSAAGAAVTPKNWTIVTEEGGPYDMWDVSLYAKNEDLE